MMSAVNVLVGIHIHSVSRSLTAGWMSERKRKGKRERESLRVVGNKYKNNDNGKGTSKRLYTSKRSYMDI